MPNDFCMKDKVIPPKDKEEKKRKEKVTFIYHGKRQKGEKEVKLIENLLITNNIDNDKRKEG